MRAILVANPKGGSGKTTLATNLAGCLANSGDAVCLWDLDRQHSSLEWLRLRPSYLPRIVRLDQREHLPKKAQWLVLDSPAALHGKHLTEMVKEAQKVLVPIQPSLFDIAATRDFLAELKEEKAIRKQRTFVGIIGSRVDPRTRAATQLISYLREHDMPLVGWVRDTMMYANAAFEGRSIFDLPAWQAEREQAMWQPILEWVKKD
ncbi:MAG TPA: ParA family protein [Burkholderiales bacterium]|nr:ParA family protein [Burkholderiales bacterium]